MMKHYLTIACLFIGLMAGIAQGPSFAYLKANFAAPGKEYGTAPLWVWNNKVTKADIDSNLYSFKDNAFGGVFIHPRPGLITEYLSPEWLDLYKYAVKKGKALGLDVWIYDENSYPSGFAGGHVNEEMPESYNDGQMLHLVKAKELPDSAAAFYICLKEENGVYRNITGQLANEKGKKGNYYLFHKEYYGRSPWYAGYSYVDLMKKGVTQKFIDVTIGKYEQIVGDEFGKTVPGIFSDEPNIEAQGRGNIRWTPDLFAAFLKKWGYGLDTCLLSLFENTGDYKRIRHNYYQTLLDLYIEGWSKPFAAYAQQKGLEWTGHYWEHEWPSPNHGPDNMAMYAWPQRPGIDLLFNQFRENIPNAQFGNIRSVKELGSVANQLDKKRTLCESYGGGGWEITLKDLKRLGDWQYVLGVNFMDQHLSYMSIAGTRKYDYPQSFSYHNPWYPYYKSLNKYYARLSLALSQGQERNDILILEPTTSAWMYFVYGKPTDFLDTARLAGKKGLQDPRFSQIAAQFQAFITRLTKAQVEYDLGSENIIKDHGKVEGKKFVIGSRAYSTVIIPPGMENVDAATFALLQRYVAGGGKLLQFEPLQRVDGDAGKLVAAFNSDPAVERVANPFGGGSDDWVRGKLSSAGFQIENEGAGGNLYHCRRQFAEGELIFLVNAALQGNAKGRIGVSGDKIWEMDLFTGVIRPYSMKTFDIPAAGSLLLFVSKGNSQVMAANSGQVVKAGSGQELKASGALKVSPVQDNYLMVDFCDLKAGAVDLADVHVYKATDTVFKYYGFANGSPWSTSVQYKSNTVARDTFSVGTGFTAAYRFIIDGGVDPAGFRAVVEQPGLYKAIRINGQVVKADGNAWWIDKDFRLFKIGSYLHTGENVLEIVADPMSIYAEIQPVYILGKFKLVSADKGWHIGVWSPVGLGSWKQQGMPLYGHEVCYRKDYQLGVMGSRIVVKLGDWKGSVAHVRVNDKEAGIIAYDPFELDITQYMRKGANKIEVFVTGTLKNVLGPHHNSPQVGAASPGLFKKPVVHPAGDAYDTYDYGLIQDFSVIAYK